MDDWDEAKLEEVVNKKHGEKNKAMPKTAIVSHILAPGTKTAIVTY